MGKYISIYVLGILLPIFLGSLGNIFRNYDYKSYLPFINSYLYDCFHSQRPDKTYS